MTSIRTAGQLPERTKPPVSLAEELLGIPEADALRFLVELACRRALDAAPAIEEACRAGRVVSDWLLKAADEEDLGERFYGLIEETGMQRLIDILTVLTSWGDGVSYGARRNLRDLPLADLYHPKRLRKNVG